MVHLQCTDPTLIGGWATLLWRMLVYLAVPRQHLPVFHAQNLIIKGKFFQWRGSVKIKVGGETFCFTGHRTGEKEARQDACRKAVLFLRHQYDEIFKYSPFRYVPQDWDNGEYTLVPRPEGWGNPQEEEVVWLVAYQDASYDKALTDYHAMCRRLLEVESKNRRLKRKLKRRQMVEDGEMSSCGETPAPRMACQGDQSHGPGAKPRRVGDARLYRQLFRRQVVRPEEENIERNDQEEEEEPMERVWYTTSHPPSDEE